jgi:hypothetical protein
VAEFVGAPLTVAVIDELLAALAGVD